MAPRSKTSATDSKRMVKKIGAGCGVGKNGKNEMSAKNKTVDMTSVTNARCSTTSLHSYAKSHAEDPKSKITIAGRSSGSDGTSKETSLKRRRISAGASRPTVDDKSSSSMAPGSKTPATDSKRMAEKIEGGCGGNKCAGQKRARQKKDPSKGSKPNRKTLKSKKNEKSAKNKAVSKSKATVAVAKPMELRSRPRDVVVAKMTSVPRAKISSTSLRNSAKSHIGHKDPKAGGTGTDRKSKDIIKALRNGTCTVRLIGDSELVPNEPLPNEILESIDKW
ncbi:Uncharacterised protein g915 [Pycnogonum litorale]